MIILKTHLKTRTSFDKNIEYLKSIMQFIFLVKIFGQSFGKKKELR